MKTSGSATSFLSLSTKPKLCRCNFCGKMFAMIARAERYARACGVLRPSHGEPKRASSGATPRRIRRRKFGSFGLRTLFGIVAVTAVSCWIGVRKAHRQQCAVNAIRAAGGGVFYDFQRDNWHDFQRDGGPTPDAEKVGVIEWARQILGDDYRGNIIEVAMSGCTNIDGNLLAHIESLAEIDELSLGDTGVGDDAIGQIVGLRRLRTLDLGGTNITDAGLMRLATLRQLIDLDVSSTRCTDRGISSLGRCMDLQFLNLSFNRGVTDLAIRQLRPLQDLRELCLFGTSVTDDAVNDLGALSALEHVFLDGDKFSADAARRLRELRPDCVVTR